MASVFVFVRFLVKILFNFVKPSLHPTIEACLIRASAAFEQFKHNSKRRLDRTAAAWPRLGEIFTGEMI